MTTHLEAAKESLADGLSEITQVCTRDWSAWSYGTMTEEDFHPADQDDELLTSLATEVLKVLGIGTEITTIEQLDDLPPLSYVRGRDGFRHEKSSEGWLLVVQGASTHHGPHEIELPATLLYRPMA